MNCTILHKGGIGNILQAIPLIKACLERYNVVYLDLQADYPATAELAKNWGDRLGGRVLLGKGEGPVINLLPPMLMSPFTGERIRKVESMKIGEAQVYLRMLTNELRADLDCRAPLHTVTSISLPDEYIVIWPGCKKNWPVKAYPHFFGLIELFLTNYPVVLVGQAAELFVHPLPDSAINLLDLLTLGEVADVIRKAVAFIGNDGGITHLAATTGTRTFAIFGPTSVEKNRPRAENCEVISANLECMPCQETQGFSLERCKLGLKPNCLGMLDPLMVFNRIMQDLKY